jgi:UDP-N-acetylmuramyl pentapeptide phosphotransferase/UDP-N-acetylglucosamine-1-phosphate transferase
MDGLDGFLATYSIFFSLNCFIYFYSFNNESFFYLFSLFLLVICSAFLIFNKPSAKIFLGDSGSIFIGYSIGFLSLFFLSILRLDIMISLICYPFIDCTLTIINKMLKGKYPWERLFDYNFLKPVKLYNKPHSYVLKYFVIYNLGLTINLFLQIVYDYRYLFIISIIYTIVLIIFFNRKN